MSETVIEGVYLSSEFDLQDHFARSFAAEADTIRMVRPEAVTDPSRIRVALAWHPETDAFLPYPNLQLVSSIAAGTDSILGCPSLPPDALVMRIVDHEQAAIMAGFAVWHVIWHQRAMGRYLANQRARVWQRIEPDPPSHWPVGLLGFGIMGKAVCAALEALGFPVSIACRSTPADGNAPASAEIFTGDDAIGAVASRSRILVSLLPLTSRTRGILNADVFSAMPRGSAIVQLGRGEHLVEDDLQAALDSGQLSGASLDVFSREPLPADHPFWSDERIVVTPHEAADANPATVARQLAGAALTVAAGGMPESIIDRSRGY